MSDEAQTPGEASKALEEHLALIEKPTIEVKDLDLRIPGQLSLSALTEVNDRAFEESTLPQVLRAWGPAG